MSEWVGGLDPSIPWVAALLLGLGCAMWHAWRSSLDVAAMYWAALGAICGGVGGAELLDALVRGTSLATGWAAAGNAPKCFYGGLAAGATVFLLILRARGRALLDYTGAAAPALALGYAVGRLGCLLNGDDYGTPTHVPWAVSFLPGTEAHAAQVAQGVIAAGAPVSLPVHPVQLYGSLVGLLLFVLVCCVPAEAPARRLGVFAVGYGLSRFCLEWLRGDAVASWAGFSVYQWGSLCLLAAGLWLWSRWSV